MAISKSPERNTFQMEKYVERCQKEGKEPSEAYLEMFEKIRSDDQRRFDDPESRIDNLEYDLRSTDWILEKVRTSESYAQNLYASMCNMQWQRIDTWPILTNKKWSCSWRYAGGIVADMRQEGDYIDWYCSGIRGDMTEPFDPIDEQRERMAILDKFVGEGVVTEEIEQDLRKLGWMPVPYSDNEV